MTYRRRPNIIGFLVCAALLGYALYSQFRLGLEPCPLCIFQRIGIALTGVMFLLAALQHPRGGGRTVYAVLIALAALATAAVAARHLYVQSLPPGTLPSCGAPLATLLKFTPALRADQEGAHRQRGVRRGQLALPGSCHARLGAARGRSP